jgi:hypothetical protein
MSNFLIDEDTDLLAAEFVLGTLDSDERASAQSLLQTDHGFIAMVRIWERRFGELHLMVEPVDPDAKIWQRIKTKVAELGPREAAPDGQAPAGSATPNPLESAATPPEAVTAEGAESAPADPPAVASPNEVSAKPEAVAPTAEAAKPPEFPSLPPAPTLPPAALPPAALPPAGDLKPSPELRPETATRAERGANGKVAAQIPPPKPPERSEAQRATRAGRGSSEITVDMIRSRDRWRAFGMIMIVLALGLGGMIAAWRFVPERLPERLRPAELMMSMGIGSAGQSAPPARQLPPGSDFDE